jgi:hypothetical protein
MGFYFKILRKKRSSPTSLSKLKMILTERENKQEGHIAQTRKF